MERTNEQGIIVNALDLRKVSRKENKGAKLVFFFFAPSLYYFAPLRESV